MALSPIGKLSRKLAEERRRRDLLLQRLEEGYARTVAIHRERNMFTAEEFERVFRQVARQIAAAERRREGR